MTQSKSIGPKVAAWSFAVLVVLIIIATRSGSGPANLNLNEAEPRPIAAARIVNDYEINEVAADQVYKGKRVSLIGSVGEIKKDLLDTPYVTLDEQDLGLRGVQAFFDNDAVPQLSALRQGEVIRVVGTCDGLMGHVLILHSRLVPVAGQIPQ